MPRPCGHDPEDPACRLCQLCAEDSARGYKYRQKWGVPEPEGFKDPTLLQKTINFGRAVVRHARKGMRKVPLEVHEERLSLCRSCTDYYDEVRQTCRHRRCGCSVGGAVLDKTSWAEQSCPVGRWGEHKEG